MSFPRFDENRRVVLRKIADETMRVIKSGHLRYRGTAYDLGHDIESSKQHTRYYSPDSSKISNWLSTGHSSTRSATRTTAEVSVLQISTLEAARLLENTYENNPNHRGRLGILNFASATKPGGGFINGAQAQEESIARASTLYPTLMIDTAQRFYDLHTRDNKSGYYSHAMIYSPDIVIFRDDDGGWPRPFKADVLTSAAVNAGEVRQSRYARHGGVEENIEKEMKERMGRILFLFEKEGVTDIVLGSFGTGVFRNDIPVVAKIWADLVAVPGARFQKSFNRIIFAITGERTFSEFQTAFKARVQGGGASVGSRAWAFLGY